MAVPRLPRGTATGASLLAALLGLTNPTCETVTSDGEPMSLEILAPAPGALESGYEPDCPVSVTVDGTVAVGSGLFDLVFVLDSSGSSGACSGVDVDGDGVTGFPTPGPFGGNVCSDPGDSILAAQVRAVRDFVDELSPDRSRVAVVQFSNPEGLIGFGARQRIVASLTDDFDLIDLALDEVLAGGSNGATDYEGGLRLARSEILLNGDPARDAIVYFMSDGVPTFPQMPLSAEDPEDSRVAVDAADDLAADGTVVNSFGVGFIPSTTLDPTIPERCLVPGPSGPELVSTLECIAVRTGGEFLESSDPAEILDALRLTRAVAIESLTLFNDTTGDSVEADVTPDGDFVGSLPVLEGEVNELRAVAVADDGTTCEATTDFTPLCFLPGCTPRTQGYWHRQCLGVGAILPGRADRGPEGARRGPPLHPDWDEEILVRLLASITPDLERLGLASEDEACEALDAEPPRDACQRAIKQFAALLLNGQGGNLSPDCELNLDDVGGLDGVFTFDEVVDVLVDLIREGLAGDPSACRKANAIADEINTGAALD